MGGVWGGAAADDAAAQTLNLTFGPSFSQAEWDAARPWFVSSSVVADETGIPKVVYRMGQSTEPPVPNAVPAGGDQPTISIIGFRGAARGSGSEDIVHPYQYTGHVAYSLDGSTIWGFGPAAGDTPAAEVLARLAARGDYPGVITPDQNVFAMVAQNPLPARGGGLQTVYEWKIPVTPEQFEAIQAAHDLLVARGAMNDIRYQFPPRTGDWPPNTYNCATFPSCLGIPIPETTGQLRLYMPELERLGTPWTPPVQQK